jgi:hypothetical protein
VNFRPSEERASEQKEVVVKPKTSLETCWDQSVEDEQPEFKV